LSKLADALKKATSVMFAQYKGLNVDSISRLRKQLKERDAEMQIPKKTLLKIALENHKLPLPDDQSMDGPIAAIFSYSDPLTGAQLTHTFSKDYPQIVLTGGIFEEKLLSQKDAVAFAKIPGREVLLATFAGMMQSPLIRFAGCIGSPLQSFARAASELAKQKESTT